MRTEPAASNGCEQLAGTWEGTLRIRSERADKEGGDLTLRVVLGERPPRVFMVDGPAWEEAKGNAWAVRCLGPSAVLHAIDSAKDGDGTWVETWVVTVTRRSGDELLARWTRMVNNVDLPPDSPSARFSRDAVGTLKRRTGRSTSACPVEPGEPTDGLGDYLMRLCDCGGAAACALLAQLVEREGNASSHETARGLRRKACSLGLAASCEPATDTRPAAGAPTPAR